MMPPPGVDGNSLSAVLGCAKNGICSVFGFISYSSERSVAVVESLFFLAMGESSSLG